MYLRITKGSSASYLVLVEGYRENGKVKQRTICNLGAIDKKIAKQSLNLGKKLLEQFGGRAIIDGSELEETQRNNWGAHKLLQQLMRRYALDDFWSKYLSFRKLEYNLPNTLQAMIAGRLCSPSSKLALYENQEFYDGFAKFKLQDLYKTLDELDKYKEPLSQHLFNKQQQINGTINITFFDVTTMYFESQKLDDLRAFGFSKDCKFNEVQIVLSLLTDDQGNPLAYELFPGNTYEGSTLETSLSKLKQKYKISKAVVVADRGMYSNTNLKSLTAMGFEYIVGTKLRSSKSDIKEQVLKAEGYSYCQEGEFKYKRISNHHRTDYHEDIVLAWSQKRANKDKQDRERLINKATKLLDKSNIDDKRGGKNI